MVISFNLQGLYPSLNPNSAFHIPVVIGGTWNCEEKKAFV